MGQGHSELAHLPAVHFNPNYEVLQKVFDAHYGDIKYIRDTKTGKEMYLKELIFNNKKAFETEASYFSKLINNQHPNLVNVIGYNFEDDHGFCSTHYKISLFIECADKNLQSEFEYHKTSKKDYTEAEILTIANHLISALSYFQDKGFSHGDIRPFNIFIMDKVYKLSDPALNAQKGSNALTLAIVPGTKTFLAPELLAQVPKSRFDISCDRYKADVFSLGVTLLSLATFTAGEDLYDYKKGVLNTNLLQQRLEALKHLFSQPVYELISSMLTLDPNARPDFKALSNRYIGSQIPGQPREAAKKSVLVEAYNAPVKTDFTFGQAHTEAPVRTAPPMETEAPLPTFAPVETEVPVNKFVPLIHDDLDAKIRAALERSNQTMRVFDASYTPAPVSNTQYSYQPPVSTLNTTAHLGAPKQEHEVKSYLPQDYHHISQPSSYTHQTYNTYTVPTSTYNPISTYDVSTKYTHHAYETKETTLPARSYEVEKTVKAYAHGDLGTYTSNPAHTIGTYTPTRTYPEYTHYATGTENVVKTAPHVDIHTTMQTYKETKPQHTIFPDWQPVNSYLVNPSPTLKPGHVNNIAGLSPFDDGDKTDRTAVSINIGDQTRAAAATHQMSNFADGAPNTYGTTTYDVTKVNTTENYGGLGFFQHVVNNPNAGGFAEQINRAGSGNQYQYSNI